MLGHKPRPLYCCVWFCQHPKARALPTCRMSDGFKPCLSCGSNVWYVSEWLNCWHQNFMDISDQDLRFYVLPLSLISILHEAVIRSPGHERTQLLRPGGLTQSAVSKEPPICGTGLAVAENLVPVDMVDSPLFCHTILDLFCTDSIYPDPGASVRGVDVRLSVAVCAALWRNGATVKLVRNWLQFAYGLWSVHLVLPRSSWNGWRGGDPSEQEVSEGRFAPWKAYFCADASGIQASGWHVVFWMMIMSLGYRLYQIIVHTRGGLHAHVIHSILPTHTHWELPVARFDISKPAAEVLICVDVCWSLNQDLTWQFCSGPRLLNT